MYGEPKPIPPKRVRAYSNRIEAANKGEVLCSSSDPNQPKDLVFEGAFNEGMKPNLITSHVVNDPGMHLVCLDIDMPAELIPSKTPGHFHLYIEHRMEWDKYVVLLRALADAGIIEKGYAEASINKGCTALRIPPYEEEFRRLKELKKLEQAKADDPTEIF